MIRKLALGLFMLAISWADGTNSGEFSPELYALMEVRMPTAYFSPGSFLSRKGMGVIQISEDRLVFEVPTMEPSRLILLDAKGDSLLELFNGQAAPLQEVPLLTTRLPQGIYQFRLEQGSRSEVFRALFMRSAS